MLEKNILNTILLEIGRRQREARIFRNNVGQAWAGEVVNNYTKDGHRYVVIKNAQPIHIGLCTGSSDLIGWYSLEITPEMVGRRVALFTAIEVKRPGKNPTIEQARFMEAVRASGGIAGVARSPDDAIKIIAYCTSTQG